VNEGVNALLNEMETLGLPAIVEILELNHPLEEELVSEFELSGR
jgi:putative effector of murein hydrolase LrgA (UPF0299 family)